MFTVSPVGGSNEVLDRRRDPGGPGRCGSKELPQPGVGFEVGRNRWV